ncbi:MAG: ribonuclease HI [Clostridiales bacterium]|jgi:ribonuclease HI|nr:ribonuclease HI [Clostridiales bacterium]
MKAVDIYTDGACLGNPGAGGYGAVLLYRGARRELSAAYTRTTNNRMEILAAIVALEALKEPCRVNLYSDSRYLVDAVEKGWAARWQAAGWMRNRREAAQNADLWERLLPLLAKHQLRFIWVRGHAENAENNRCDAMARAAIEAAAKNGDFLEDIGYERHEN